MRRTLMFAGVLGLVWSADVQAAPAAAWPDERIAARCPLDDEPPPQDEQPVRRRFSERRGEGPRDDRPREGDEREGRRGLRGRPPRPPSPEMIDRTMEVLREKLPELHEKLDHLRRERPDVFPRALGHVMPVMREYLWLRDRDPELAETVIEEFRIEGELFKLGVRYARMAKDPQTADAAQLEQLEAEITDRVKRQFQLQLRRREARLQDFAQRLRGLQARMDEERAAVDQAAAEEPERVARRVEAIKRGQFHEPPMLEPGRPDGRDGIGPPGPEGRRRSRNRLQEPFDEPPPPRDRPSDPCSG